MYGSRAVTLLVLTSEDVINRILKLDIQTNNLVYVTTCCTDLTSKVLKERTFGQSSAVPVLPRVGREERKPVYGVSDKVSLNQHAQLSYKTSGLI